MYKLIKIKYDIISETIISNETIAFAQTIQRLNEDLNNLVQTTRNNNPSILCLSTKGKKNELRRRYFIDLEERTITFYTGVDSAKEITSIPMISVYVATAYNLWQKNLPTDNTKLLKKKLRKSRTTAIREAKYDRKCMSEPVKDTTFSDKLQAALAA